MQGLETTQLPSVQVYTESQAPADEETQELLSVGVSPEAAKLFNLLQSHLNYFFSKQIIEQQMDEQLSGDTPKSLSVIIREANQHLKKVRPSLQVVHTHTQIALIEHDV